MGRSSNKSAINSGIWFTISNFILKGISFITTPLFTRLMTQAEYGEYSNFTTWCGIVLIITSLNLEASFIRSRFDYENDLDTYSLSMCALSGASTLIWYVIFFLCQDFFVNALAMDKVYIHCMFIYLFFMPAINIFQNLERFRYEYKTTVFISILLSVSVSLLSVLFVVKFENKFLGRTLGYVLPVVVVSLAVLFLFLRKKARLRIRYWKYALPIAIPYIPHLLSMIVLGGIDRIMIKKFCGAEEAALYSLAYTVGTIVSMLVSSINSAFSPWLGEHLAGKNYSPVRKMSFPYVLGACSLSVLMVLMSPEILLILGGESYIVACNVIPPVVAGCLMQFVYSMYVNIEQYEKQTIPMACASLLAAILNSVLNYIFIPQFGYVSGAYTTLVSYTVLMIMHMILVSKLGLLKVYSNKKIVLSVLICTTILILASFLFEAQLVRFIISGIIFMVIFIFTYRKRAVIREITKGR